MRTQDENSLDIHDWQHPHTLHWLVPIFSYRIKWHCLWCVHVHTLWEDAPEVCVRGGQGTTWGSPFSPSSSLSLGLSCFCWPEHPRLASLPGKFSYLSLPSWVWRAEIKNLPLHLFFFLNNDLDQAMSSFSKCFNSHFYWPFYWPLEMILNDVKSSAINNKNTMKFKLLPRVSSLGAIIQINILLIPLKELLPFAHLQANDICSEEKVLSSQLRGHFRVELKYGKRPSSLLVWKL